MEPKRLPFGNAGLCHAALLVSLFLVTAVSTSSAQSENVDLLSNVDEDAAYNDVWGYTAPNGDEYAILGTDNGTAFYNVTVPTAPLRVHFEDGPNSTWRDMKTYGDNCYIVSEGGSPGSQAGMQIVDLSDPENPSLVTVMQEFQTAHNIFIDVPGGRAYVVGTDNGTVVYDLAANADNPPVIGTFNALYIHDIYVQDNIAWAAHISNGTAGVWDVTNANAWVELNQWSYPGAATHNTWTNADQSVLVTTDETGGGHLNFWDVSDPTNEIFLDDYTADPAASAHNAFFRGDFVYVSYYTEGLRIINVGDPANVEEVGFYDTFAGGGLFAGAWGAYPFAAQEGIVYVSDISNGLFVLQFNPNFGTVTGTVTDANTQQPIEGATVEFVESGDIRTTDANGFYLASLDPGSYTVSVTAFGYSGDSDPLTVVAGETATLDFVLDPVASGSVSGTISDAGSSPIGDAEVTIVGTPLLDISTAAGVYEFPMVPVGIYDVNVQRFRYAPGSGQAVITELEGTVVDFSLTDAIFWTEMESDPGWSLSGNASTGQWTRVDPVGSGGGAVQPEDDHTIAPGVQCWVTGQGLPGGTVGANDVDNGSTILTTPVFDLSPAGDPIVQYYRWYVNDAGSNPGTDTWVVEVSPDAGANWLIVEATTQSDASWKLVELRLRDLFPEPSVLSQIQFRFTASDLGGGSIVEAGVDDFQVYDDDPSTTGISEVVAAPTAPLRIDGNFPNPFNPTTAIRFEMGATNDVHLRIYDTNGRMVRDLLDQRLNAGVHNVTWDGRNQNGRSMSSGVYFYRIEVGALIETRRMVLAK